MEPRNNIQSNINPLFTPILEILKEYKEKELKYTLQYQEPNATLNITAQNLRRAGDDLLGFIENPKTLVKNKNSLPYFNRLEPYLNDLSINERTILKTFIKNYFQNNFFIFTIQPEHILNQM